MNLNDALDAVWTRRWSRQRDGGQSRDRARRCLRLLQGRPSRRTLAALALALEAEGLAPATVNRHLSALSAVLAEAGLELELPWRREPRGRDARVTGAQLAALLAALPPTMASLATFLAETGMRVGEACALGEEDIVGEMVHVRDSKNRDDRRVPLTERALAAWSASPCGWSLMSRSSFQHAFRRAAADAGVPGLRPHDLRHLAASRLVAAGVPLPTVQAWLGHRDYRSTLRYVHVGSEALVRARDMLESLPSPSTSSTLPTPSTPSTGINLSTLASVA